MEAGPKEVVETLSQFFSNTKQVYISSLDNSHPVVAEIIASGKQFVGKGASYAELALAIQRGAEQKQTVGETPINEYQTTIQVPGQKRLTHKQVAVMGGIAEGLTVKEIARKVNNSPDTVKAHVREAYIRLGADNRATAVVAFQRAKGLSEAIA